MLCKMVISNVKYSYALQNHWHASSISNEEKLKQCYRCFCSYSINAYRYNTSMLMFSRLHLSTCKIVIITEHTLLRPKGTIWVFNATAMHLKRLKTVIWCNEAGVSPAHPLESWKVQLVGSLFTLTYNIN